MSGIRGAALTGLALVAVAGMAQTVAAQALPDTVLHPGSRVRVQSPLLGSAPRIGSFLSIASDTLSITLEGTTQPTRIPVARVDALEISVRRSTNIVRDADKGSHYGGWIGAIVLGATATAGAPSGDNGLRVLLGLLGAAAGYFVGQIYGTVAGGVAGAIDRTDEWKPVMLPAPGS